MASYATSKQPESAWIVYAGSNFPDPIRFCSSKDGLDPIVRTLPGSSLDGLFRFWPNASGPEASWCARIIAPSSGRAETARYQFPLSDSVIFFHRQPGSYYAKPAWVRLDSGLLCQVLAKQIQSGSQPASVHKSLGPSSGQCFTADWDQMWIRSDMFTGKQQTFRRGCWLVDGF